MFLHNLYSLWPDPFVQVYNVYVIAITGLQALNPKLATNIGRAIPGPRWGRQGHEILDTINNHILGRTRALTAAGCQDVEMNCVPPLSLWQLRISHERQNERRQMDSFVRYCGGASRGLL